MTTALFIGRFQPFHKGHLKAILDLLKNSDKVIIGIGSSQYAKTKDNPFSAEERVKMIRSSLDDEGVSDEAYEIVKIPDIHDNERWARHVKLCCPHFDIAYSRNGLVTELLAEDKIKTEKQTAYDMKKYNGTKIRDMILKGKDISDLVPNAVLKVINR